MEAKNKYVLFEITPEIEHFAELTAKAFSQDLRTFQTYAQQRS